MLANMLKSLRKSLSLQQKCLQHKNQVDNAESVHGANLANCIFCVEETKQCKCDHNNIEDTKSAEGGTNLDAEHDSEANCSFTHAVINMVGMLIGKVCTIVYVPFEWTYMNVSF